MRALSLVMRLIVKRLRYGHYLRVTKGKVNIKQRIMDTSKRLKLFI